MLHAWVSHDSSLYTNALHRDPYSPPRGSPGQGWTGCDVPQRVWPRRRHPIDSHALSERWKCSMSMVGRSIVRREDVWDFGMRIITVSTRGVGVSWVVRCVRCFATSPTSFQDHCLFTHRGTTPFGRTWLRPGSAWKYDQSTDLHGRAKRMV